MAEAAAVVVSPDAGFSRLTFHDRRRKDFFSRRRRRRTGGGSKLTEKGFPDKPLSISSLGRRAKDGGEWVFKCCGGGGGIREAKPPPPPPCPFTSRRVTVGDKGREGKGPRNFALWKSGVRGGSPLANGKPVPCVSLSSPSCNFH